jgi:hypothetical protein
MIEKTLKALVEAGAVKRVRVIGNGANFHVEFETTTGAVTASTGRNAVKQWVTLDAAARWLKRLGIGTAQVELALWSPGQKRLV